MKLCLFTMAFVVAYFGAFWISELFHGSKKCRSGISYDNVLLEQLLVRFFLQRSKMNSLGWGVCISLQTQGDSSLCPVALVKQLVFLSPQVGGHFFIRTNALPFTKYQLNFVLHKCLGHLGLSNYQFSPHSFIIGAASEAARRGLAVHAIKELGRWRSDCLKCV